MRRGGKLALPFAGRGGGLPQRLQMVIQLHFVEALNLAEIVEVLVVSVRRVHQLKARALDKLRTALEVGRIVREPSFEGGLLNGSRVPDLASPRLPCGCAWTAGLDLQIQRRERQQCQR